MHLDTKEFLFLEKGTESKRPLPPPPVVVFFFEMTFFIQGRRHHPIVRGLSSVRFRRCSELDNGKMKTRSTSSKIEVARTCSRHGGPILQNLTPTPPHV